MSWTRIVRLQKKYWHTYYWDYNYRQVFLFSHSTYLVQPLTLENCRDLNMSKK